MRFETRNFMNEAKNLLKLGPSWTRQRELDRMSYLKRKGVGVVSKYSDIRKVLGWGPSLATQRTYRPAGAENVTIPLQSLKRMGPQLSNRRKDERAVGMNVISNRMANPRGLPDLAYH